jgi:DnaJ-class molecular chaperone
LIGNGRCSKCHGSGINLRLTSNDPKCPACDGTGVCRTCDGSGLWAPPEDENGPDELEIPHVF